MPTEVKTRASESLSPKLRRTDKYPDHDLRAAHKVSQQQHREALRLALGSILSPKRPPLNSSRSSSGSTTPSYPFSMPSGSHTPAGTPPSYYPLAHVSNSSEYLYSHHPHVYHPHPHTPSRLGRSNSSSNSPSGNGENSLPNSSQPSPLPPFSHNLPSPPEIELPPAQISIGVTPAEGSTPLPAPDTPFQPTSSNPTSGHPPIPTDDADHATRAGSPRSKFLQTLQSKSAWDALIHGSFS